MLESTRRLLSEFQHEVRINIGELDQRDVAYQAKSTLKEENQSISTNDQNGINKEIDIIVIINVHHIILFGFAFF